MELVDHAVSELKRARAAGPGGITGEHCTANPPSLDSCFVVAVISLDFGVGNWHDNTVVER